MENVQHPPMDSTREIRSMMMASFPCPPLAMEGDFRSSNSHDMLAYLVDVAARRNDAKDNAARMRNQEILLSEYFDNLALCNTEAETWDLMTKFTRQYMMTYNILMHETRFLPFDAVSVPIRRQVCSWLAAQHILQGDDQVDGGFFENLAPWPLYRRCRDIILEEDSFSMALHPALQQSGAQ